MITPAFELNQNEKFLIVIIKAPYTKVSETEIEFFNNEFRFYSKPYFLRLILPGNVLENGEESAKYDANTGSFTINVPKSNEGEFFEGLEFQTKLLSTRKPAFKSPVIEVLGDRNNEQSEDDEFCWDIIQNQYTEDQDTLIEEAHYGFANQKNGVFTKLRDEIPDLVDVKDPDKKTIQQRKKEKSELEQEQFNDDHYLADLYQDSEVKKILNYLPYYIELYKKKDKTTDVESLITFTESEQERMRNLPNKEYLLDHSLKQQVLLSIVDILLAYCYNFRTTEGENTVETAWTITKLSSTLCWLDSFSSLDSVILSFMRRSLCYPLHRNWELSKTVVQDAITLLSLGSKMVLKCFLDIHSNFNNSDPYYLLNELYITDICVWIQTLKSTVFVKMAEALTKICIEKQDVGLELVELEEAARLAIDEEGNERTEESTSQLANQMQQLQLNKPNNENVNHEESSDDDESEESSEESTTDSDDYSSHSEIDSDDNEGSSSGSEDECLIFGKDEQSHERRR